SCLVREFRYIWDSISTALCFIIFFILRTQISLKYYKVNYPLIKIYFMMLIVSGYGVYSIIASGFWTNLFMAIIPVVILVVVFYKDLLYIFQNRKMLFK